MYFYIQLIVPALKSENTTQLEGRLQVDHYEETRILEPSPKRRKLSNGSNSFDHMAMVQTDMWNLPSTLEQDFSRHEPIAMFSEGTSTIPDNTIDRLHVAEQTMRTDREELPFGLVEPKIQLDAKSSLPWSEILREQDFVERELPNTYDSVYQSPNLVHVQLPSNFEPNGHEQGGETTVGHKDGQGQQDFSPADQFDINAKVSESIHADDDEELVATPVEVERDEPTFTPSGTPIKKSVYANSTSASTLKKKSSNRKLLKATKKKIRKRQVLDDSEDELSRDELGGQGDFAFLAPTEPEHGQCSGVDSDSNRKLAKRVANRLRYSSPIEGLPSQGVMVVIPSVKETFSTSSNTGAHTTSKKAVNTKNKVPTITKGGNPPESSKPAPSTIVPVKKGRGRPRKIPQKPQDPAPAIETAPKTKVATAISFKEAEQNTASTTRVKTPDMILKADDAVHKPEVQASAKSNLQSDDKENAAPTKASLDKITAKAPLQSNGKVPYRVGLSRRTRIAPLLRVVRK